MKFRADENGNHVITMRDRFPGADAYPGKLIDYRGSWGGSNYGFAKDMHTECVTWDDVEIKPGGLLVAYYYAFLDGVLTCFTDMNQRNRAVKDAVGERYYRDYPGGPKLRREWDTWNWSVTVQVLKQVYVEGGWLTAGQLLDSLNTLKANAVPQDFRVGYRLGCPRAPYPADESAWMPAAEHVCQQRHSNILWKARILDTGEIVNAQWAMWGSAPEPAGWSESFSAPFPETDYWDDEVLPWTRQYNPKDIHPSWYHSERYTESAYLQQLYQARRDADAGTRCPVHMIGAERYACEVRNGDFAHLVDLARAEKKAA